MTSPSATSGTGTSNRSGTLRSGPILALVLFAFFVYITAAATGFPGAARNFPIVLGVSGLVLSLITLLQELRQGSTNSVSAARRNEGPNEATAARQVTTVMAYGFGAAYIFVTTILGFLVGTFLMCTVWPYAIGYRSLPKLLAFNAGLLGFLWLVFDVALGLRLPEGIVFARLS